jgi:xyloglucan-specific endo-beta-1,4-glucanase
MNGSMKVFSFIAANLPATNFNADIKQFYNYLQSSQGFPASSQYLISMYSSHSALFMP